MKEKANDDVLAGMWATKSINNEAASFIEGFCLHGSRLYVLHLHL